MGGFEGGIRVPALISYPSAGWTGGRILDQATSMMDVYPTIIKQTNTPTHKIQLNRANQTNDLGKDQYNKANYVTVNYVMIHNKNFRW